MSKKMKTNKYYLRFYDTGEFRKILAKDLNDAYTKAEAMFEDRKFTIGTLLTRSDSIPIDKIMLKR